ncbi:MAG TPA: hypothetical protein P5567_00100 [Kiritimatiellia bacterium]|nr:hypothetical protein [Kiritimatiellia bacterium]HSA18890.1 hypothetical protein [Kiritimatiellia bacterium]
MRSKTILLCWVLGMVLGLRAGAITIGAGPAIGTDKRGTTWYQEFQDWGQSDVRALDANDDEYKFYNAEDTGRDLVALYSHDDGTNVFFRMDFFELGYGWESGSVDVYLAIDCAPGGQEWLPDYMDTKTDRPWEGCVGVYNSSAGSLYDAGWTNHASDYLGSYWRNDLDGVEFGIKRSFLTARGWNGAATSLYLQAFSCRDGTDHGSGEIDVDASDIVDHFATLVRGTSTTNGWLLGGTRADATTGRAKYGVIAHANQSVATRSGTQGHIYTDRSDINLHPGFVRLLDSAEMLNTPVNLHISGTLLMSFLWAAQNPSESGYPNRDGPTFLNRVKTFVTTGPGGLVGGVLAEHIMPYFEGEVNAKSIEQNSELIEHLFGLSESDMKVMHVPERVIHTDTNSAHVDPAGPLDGKTFEEIAATDFTATYLDEVTHLHWWFYSGEQTNAGWDTANCGRWAGGQGNDEEAYHHKVHKINGVFCFMINDREDQSKFGNSDGGMMNDTRYTLLQKARDADSSKLTLVFDDWEAFAGNSFASATPNNNADQFHATLRWAANHPWIEFVKLGTVAGWAASDASWVIDHGYVYDKSNQNYEWLKRASEHDYDHWYYGSAQEESFYSRVPVLHDSWSPGGMKMYGDLNTPGTLMRDSWDAIQSIADSDQLKKIAEWSYSAMIYETAWHDEDANPDQYKSRNYQATFNRTTAEGNCDDSYEDTTWDDTSDWATRLHGHVRDMGVMADAAGWVADVRSGAQGPRATVYAADVDDDTLDEYILCNNKVYLCFERWGARLVKAFVYDASIGSGDGRMVVGAPISNPPEESENEGADNNRCSAFKDRYSTGQTNAYVDMDFAFSAPVAGSNSWTFVSSDGRIAKKITLLNGRDVAVAEYGLAAAVGTLYTRFGLGPNQLDLMFNGTQNLQRVSDPSFRGLLNTQGGEAYMVRGDNCGAITTAISNAGWDNRELPLTEQFEAYNTATGFSVALAFSQSSARDVDGDGLANTNEWGIGSQHMKADSDGDGIPDGYETGNGLAVLVADGTGDLDEDGALNYEEYVMNTGADDSNDVLRLEQAGVASGAFRIEHPVSGPRQYQVLFADGLGAGWNWQAFGNTNAPVGSWATTNAGAARHVFTDDFTAATSGTMPTNGPRVYTIRVSVPE